MDAIRAVGPGPIDPMRGIQGPAVARMSFQEMLQKSIEQVNTLQVEADRTLARLHRGEATPQDVAVAFRKAQMALDSLLQIRDRLVGAFEEIQRMRI